MVNTTRLRYPFLMSIFHTIFDKFYPLIRFVYERLLGQRWYDRIIDRLWLGGAPTYPRDYDFLLKNGIGAVVDIRQEREDDLALFERHGIRSLKLRVPDMLVPPADMIDEGVAFMRENIAEGRDVYVHCAKGRGRSATLVAAYLMKYEGLSFEEARELMEKARPLVKLESRHEQVLKNWIGERA